MHDVVITRQQLKRGNPKILMSKLFADCVFPLA